MLSVPPSRARRYTRSYSSSYIASLYVNSPHQINRASAYPIPRLFSCPPFLKHRTLDQSPFSSLPHHVCFPPSRHRGFQPSSSSTTFSIPPKFAVRSTLSFSISAPLTCDTAHATLHQTLRRRVCSINPPPRSRLSVRQNYPRTHRPKTATSSQQNAPVSRPGTNTI